MKKGSNTKKKSELIEMSPENPNLRYNSEVKIVKGLYVGYVGKIIDRKILYNLGIRLYRVILNSYDTVELLEQEIEPILSDKTDSKDE